MIDEHQLDEDGEHDPDECELCIEHNDTVCNGCRCGNCCEGLLIEVSLRDAAREPKIKDCRPIYDDMSGVRKLIGYVLNDRNNGYACRFFDRQTRLCTIYETRPLACRVFDCSQYEHAEIRTDSSASPSESVPGQTS